MSHQVLSATWAYLYKVLWNWAGILLAIDAVVALAERYLGEVVERVFHRKPRIPVRYKLGFAAAVLVVAQAVAYHDLQGELDQSNHNNDELRSAVSMKDQKIGVQEQEIKDLRSAPPKVIYRKSDAGGDSKRADALKRTIQGRLTAYINAGLSLGNDWTKRLGGTEEVQRQSALAIQGWHKAVDLATRPSGVWVTGKLIPCPELPATIDGKLGPVKEAISNGLGISLSDLLRGVDSGHKKRRR